MGVFGSFIFCLLTCLIIQLPGNFFWHWLIFFITGQTGIALAYCCGAVARNMDEANTLLPVYNVTGMFFTGVLFTYNEIPSGWRWYTWTSFVRYAWCAHMVNNFGPIEYWGIDTGSAGTEVWKNFGAMIGFWVFFICLAWFTMTNVRHVKR